MVRESEPVRVVWTEGLIIKIRLPKLLELMKNFFGKVLLFVCGGGHPEIALQKQGWQFGRKQTVKQSYQSETTPPPNMEKSMMTKWNL